MKENQKNTIFKYLSPAKKVKREELEIEEPTTDTSIQADIYNSMSLTVESIDFKGTTDLKTPSTDLKISSTEFKTPSTEFRTPSTEFKTLSTELLFTSNDLKTFSESEEIIKRGKPIKTELSVKENIIVNVEENNNVESEYFFSEKVESTKKTEIKNSVGESNINEDNKNKYCLDEESTKKSDKKSDLRYDFLLNIRDQNGIKIGEPGYDNTTLLIPQKWYLKFTDFEKQFWDIKKTHFDTIVCFKKGKFYELYEGDAELGAKLFDLKIAERVNMKMAGFPEKSFDYWAGKFLEHGYKVARVEQVENAIAKNIREREEMGKKDKLIKRELREIVTAGTIYNAENIKTYMSIYLAVVEKNDNEVSILLYDASTNKIYVDTFCDDEECNELRTVFAQNDIKEIICDCNIKLDYIPSKNKPIKGGLFLDFKNRFENYKEFQCFTYLANYMNSLKRLKFMDTVSIDRMKNKKETNFLLDSITIKNMEILNNNDDETENFSLYKQINYCNTSFGKRLIKSFMLSPLKNKELIYERQNCVNAVDKMDLISLKESLKKFSDLERLVGRCLATNPRLSDTINLVKNLKLAIKFIQTFTENFARSCKNEDDESIKKGQKIIMGKINGLPNITEIMNKFESKYVVNEESIDPCDDADDELNVLLKTQKMLHERMQKYVQNEKSKLKADIKFKDLGKEIFQMEIPVDVKVPEDYTLTSSTKTHRRFYTPKLKEMVKEFSECEEMIFQSRETLLLRAIDFLMEHKNIFYTITGFIALIDVFYSFCIFGRNNKSVYPIFGNRMRIMGMGSVIYSGFVKSDIVMDDLNVLILTGPNMGGKSTLLRSLCYNVILAHMGMKVLAEEFECKIYDKIFTRIGANDNLSRGESTFMIEMLETAKILKEVTSESFVIMDELGRGTSIKDGEAIARAVIEYLREKRATLFFSTHYHNMIDKIENVEKGFMSYEKIDEDVNFLYKLQKGVTYESYGIYVAKLSNLPISIIEDAKRIRERLLLKWEDI